ncbi:MAG TPA: DNA polymerase III subunit chi [Burkholderiaceae bacterium]|nr:DNA polymerase III subunit chi [Burkholderiaceae bacterium]
MRLEFHTDIADPLGYSCRLLRKAYRRAARVVVCGEPDRLSRLDTLLWTFEQLEFVPHARLRAGERPDAALLKHTPIWLTDVGAAWPQADVVINLGDQPVDEPQRFERIIEIVGDAAADRQAGRARWRHYTTLGLTPALANAAATAATDESGASS